MRDVSLWVTLIREDYYFYDFCHACWQFLGDRLKWSASWDSCWTAGFVSQQTIADGKGVMYLMYVSIAMLIQVTAHPIPSPQQISISKWLNQLQYIIISMFSRTIVYIYFANMYKLMSRLRRNKIIFSADILFVFCEWVTYSGLSPLELPISYFTVWLLKLPLKICAVLSNWKHKISIMISQ